MHIDQKDRKTLGIKAILMKSKEIVKQTNK